MKTSEWMPVAERLPEEKRNVRIKAKDRHGWFVKKVRLMPNRKWVDKYGREYKPFEWQGIAAPPEGE